MLGVPHGSEPLLTELQDHSTVILTSFALYIAKHISWNVHLLAMKESLLVRAKNNAAILRALLIIPVVVKSDHIKLSGKTVSAAREILLAADMEWLSFFFFA